MIAIGINATASDDRTTKKQMSRMKELDVTKDEIVNVIRVGSMPTSGMPPLQEGHESIVRNTGEIFFLP